MYLLKDKLRQKRIEQGWLPLDRNENLDTKLSTYIHSQLKKFNSVNLYPNYELFIDKLAKFLGVSADTILPVAGCTEAIKISFSLITKESRCLILKPSYKYAEHLFIKNNSKVYTIPCDSKIEDIIKFIKANKINFFYLCNPNNPTGDLLGLKDLTRLVTACKHNKCNIFIDEAYYEFSGVTGINLIKKFDNLLIGRSFSKAWGLAGLRAGLLIGNKKIINKIILNRLKGSFSSVSIFLILKLIKNYNKVLNSIKKNKKNLKHIANYIINNGGIILNKPTVNFLYFKSNKSIFNNKKCLIKKIHSNQYCISSANYEKIL